TALATALAPALAPAVPAGSALAASASSVPAALATSISTVATLAPALSSLGALATFAGGLLGRRSADVALGTLVLVLQEGLARHLDPVLLVDGDHLHLDLVAQLDHILDPADVLVVQLADVAQGVLAGRDLDEGAEFPDGDHLALVDPADL